MDSKDCSSIAIMPSLIYLLLPRYHYTIIIPLPIILVHREYIRYKFKLSYINKSVITIYKVNIN